MPHYCDNRLKIHCDDRQMMETIHRLLYERVNGKLEYTMNKLLPVPIDSSTLLGYRVQDPYKKLYSWGTRRDFCWPELRTDKDEITLKYHTKFGPNNLWVSELCSQIFVMNEKFTGNTGPKTFVKHHFTLCEVDQAGYLYWEPDMDPKYDWCSLDEYESRYEKEIQVLIEEDRRDMEVFEFHLEDLLVEEPYEDDFEIRFQRYGWEMAYLP